MSVLGRLLFAVVMSLLTAPAAATADTAAVLDVVDRFMRAIATNDVEALAALRLAGALNIVESPDGSGGTRVTRRPFDGSRYRTGTYLERYWDPVVHVRGSLAVV
jgi:hypothetical protein